MPAARYWRAVGLQAVGGGALELSALHLYLAGARVDAAATLTSTIAPSSGQLSALQDDDTASAVRWLDVSAPGFALAWDFGAGATQEVLAVRLGAGALYAEWLETLTLQHSSDGVAWVTLGSIAAFSWAGANAMQAVPADGDKHFLSTSLLIQPRAAGTSFSDESPAQHGVTASGNVIAVSDAASPTGYSASFDGSGDWLGVARSSALVFGSGDFTVECRVTASPAARDRALIDFFASGAGGWQVYLNSSGKPCFYENAPNATVLIGPSSVANGSPHNIAFSRAGTTLRLFVNGVLSGSVANSKTHINPNVDLFIAAQVGTRNPVYDFDGKLSSVWLTKGIARYTADFTPPTAPFPDSPVGAALATPPAPRGIAQAPAIVLSGGASAPAGPVLQPVAATQDLQDGGGFRIYGTTELDADPTDVPVRRRVQLYSQRDGRLVRETWSDAATGAYRFDRVRGGDGTRYFVVAFDHTRDKRAVVADNLVPEVMP